MGTAWAPATSTRQVSDEVICTLQGHLRLSNAVATAFTNAPLRCLATAGRRRELLQRAVLFHVLLTSYEFAVAEADDLRKLVGRAPRFLV